MGEVSPHILSFFASIPFFTPFPPQDDNKKDSSKKEAAAEEKQQPKSGDEIKKDGDGGGGGKKEDKAAAGGDGKKEDKSSPPPPPEEVVMCVHMHCEGCAKKVLRSLRGFDGVEKVEADTKSHKVVVKGKKAAADPMKLVARVQRKTGRKVELLSPLPPPPEAEKKDGDAKKGEEAEKKDAAAAPAEPAAKPQEKKAPATVASVVKVHMHCEACAQEIKKRILKMKGVQNVEADLKASTVTVTGVFDPLKLEEYVYKRTGKHAAVVKTEPVPAPSAEEKPKDGENKDDGKKEDKKDGKEGDKKEEKEGGGGGDGSNAEENAAALAAARVEKMVNDLYMHYPRYAATLYGYNNGGAGYPYPQPSYAPQIFSDENPNACTVM